MTISAQQPVKADIRIAATAVPVRDTATVENQGKAGIDRDRLELGRLPSGRMLAAEGHVSVRRNAGICQGEGAAHSVYRIVPITSQDQLLVDVNRPGVGPECYAIQADRITMGNRRIQDTPAWGYGNLAERARAGYLPEATTDLEKVVLNETVLLAGVKAPTHHPWPLVSSKAVRGEYFATERKLAAAATLLEQDYASSKVEVPINAGGARAKGKLSLGVPGDATITSHDDSVIAVAKRQVGDARSPQQRKYEESLLGKVFFGGPGAAGQQSP